MARRSYRRSSSRSKGRKSSGRRRSGGSRGRQAPSTRSGHSLPIVPLGIAAVGGYLLWQHIQTQKAIAAATALQTQAAKDAAAAMTDVSQTLPSF